MKALSFALIASVMVLSSCQKEGSAGSNSPKTKTELITSAAWKYKEAKIDTNNDGIGDVAVPAGVIESCQTDNTITFSTGSGTVNEGATKCDATDPQTIPFTWSFTNNETMINFSSAVLSGFGGDFKLVSLTETELIISQAVTIPPSPIAITIVATFQH